jgi:hypothetical protein
MFSQNCDHLSALGQRGRCCRVWRAREQVLDDTAARKVAHEELSRARPMPRPASQVLTDAHAQVTRSSLRVRRCCPVQLRPHPAGRSGGARSRSRPTDMDQSPKVDRVPGHPHRHLPVPHRLRHRGLRRPPRLCRSSSPPSPSSRTSSMAGFAHSVLIINC